MITLLFVILALIVILLCVILVLLLKVLNLFKNKESQASDDELLDKARTVVTAAGQASASLLQRKLRIGYARAASFLDLLEDEGTIDSGKGARPRKLL